MRGRFPVTLFATAVAPFLALVAWHWHYGPLLGLGDWAHYLLHADALRTSRGDGDIGFTSLNSAIGPTVADIRPIVPVVWGISVPPWWPSLPSRKVDISCHSLRSPCTFSRPV